MFFLLKVAIWVRFSISLILDKFRWKQSTSFFSIFKQTQHSIKVRKTKFRIKENACLMFAFVQIPNYYGLWAMVFWCCLKWKKQPVLYSYNGPNSIILCLALICLMLRQPLVKLSRQMLAIYLWTLLPISKRQFDMRDNLIAA